MPRTVEGRKSSARGGLNATHDAGPEAPRAPRRRQLIVPHERVGHTRHVPAHGHIRGLHAQPLEDLFLAVLPVPAHAFVQHAVKFDLRFPATFLDGGNQRLLVSVSKESRNVGVVDGLERREGGLGVEVGDLGAESSGVDLGLCEEIRSKEYRYLVRLATARWNWKLQLTLSRHLARTVARRPTAATAVRSGLAQA